MTRFFRILMLFMLFSVYTLSQELDEQFLASLPELTGQSIGDNSKDKLERERKEVLNNRPETRINNLDSYLESIKKDIISAENIINNELGINNADLSEYGSQFFSSYQSSFYSVNEENFSSDYILGVGDILNIQIAGTINIDDSVAVGRDGSINLKKIGSVNVSNLPFEVALKNITSYVQSRVPGADVFVNLSEARDIRVLLVGESEKPGAYVLPAGTGIFALLHAAGGPSKLGSYRKITHKRNGELIQELDLYDLFIFGNTKDHKPLRNGDIVIVNPAGKKVALTGGINVPAIYELMPNEGINELLLFSKGFSQSGNFPVILTSGGYKKIINDDISLKSVVINHGDSIAVTSFDSKLSKTSYIEITGHVAKPGKYSFNDGERLSDILIKAGGFRDNAYPEGGFFYRESVAEIQKTYINKAYNELIAFSASQSAGPNKSNIFYSSNLDRVLYELKNIEPEGRALVKFDIDELISEPSNDILLEDGDRIYIPQFSNQVVVIGEVQNPGSKSFKSSRSVSEYLSISGGLGKFADKKRIVIINPDGSSRTLISSNKFFKFNNEDDFLLPGSIIYVPREIGKIEGIEFAATIAPIISSIAISLASLNSIDN